MRKYLTKKNKSNDSLPIILIDSREKKPWTFSMYATESQCLSVGDYTFKGYEDVFVIERKQNIQELLTDVAGKNRKWFKEFLARLSTVKHAIIVVEDSADNLSNALNHIGKSEMTGQTFYWLMSTIVLKYGITVLFVGKNFRVRTGDVDTFFYHLFEELKGL